jgi:hypothetical protein
MSEERVKTKDEINNLSPSTEVNISYQVNQNKIQTSENININNKDVYLTYGKYKIFSYDSNGDPLYLIGPDYGFFIAILIVNLIYFLFISGILIALTKYYIAIIGILLNISQFASCIICGIKNPGLPKKALQNELVRAINRMSPYWQKQNDVDDNISTIIYNANTIEDLQECPDMNYALHRWYNFKTSKFYENVFAACGAIPEQNEKNKEIDFYLDGIPYDLKVTIFPNALRKKAYLYDMTRRQGKNNLIKWLYKNQSNEGRHHNANRIFIVCDEQSIEKSLILKCRFDIIKPKIIAFVNYTKKKGHNNILINNKKVYSDIIYIKL